jgi:alkanesulfonate monooxygenase
LDRPQPVRLRHPAPGGGHYLVGSAEQVAERCASTRAEGVSAFILSGFPLVDEAQRVADLLFPLLELDHGFAVTLLNGSHRQEG